MSGEAAVDAARGAHGVNGIVVVDKEAGWTSHDVVARCRQIFGQRRVGHGGTLDPDATGVLVVALGSATRLLRFMASLHKVYRAEIVLGSTTSTLDRSGVTIEHWDMSGITLADVRKAAARFVGEIDQVPPMVSALKVGGQPLHRLARQGLEVPRAPRRVVVYRFEILGHAGECGVFEAEIECSSGTYVRALADDLGRALGGGAHLGWLRRTAVGRFGEAQAWRLGALAEAVARLDAGQERSSLDGVQPSDGLRSARGAGPSSSPEALVLPPLDAVAHLPQLPVEPGLRARIAHGALLDRAAVRADGAGPWALVADGRLVAVYEAAAENRLRPAVVLA